MKNHESFGGSEVLPNQDLSKHDKKLVNYYLSDGDDRYIFESKNPRFSESSVGQAETEKALRKLSVGNKKEIREAEVNLLKNIVGPGDLPDGNENIFRRMEDDKHQRKILGFMADPEREEDDETSEEDVKVFLEKYPTPIDFEDDASAFLKIIKAENGEKKQHEYIDAMENFAKNVYGKKYEYYKAMQSLHRMAERHHGARTDGELEESGFSEKEKGRDRKLGYFANMFGLGGERREREKLVKDAGQSTANKSEFSRTPWQKNEDEAYCNPDSGVFGVFDGAGGERGGARASKLAAETLKRAVLIGKPRNTSELAKIMIDANNAVRDDENAGITTGVVGSVVKKFGKKVLVFASVGDSRLYLIRDGMARQITRDEGHGNMIDNALGFEEANVQQYGELSLEKGDKLLFCSDGITGDTSDDFVTEYEIASAIKDAKNATEAADILVHQTAKKHDDRTAVVVYV